MRELLCRGHEIWTADAGDILTRGREVLARARRVTLPSDRPKSKHFLQEKTRLIRLRDMNLVLIRKEPPVDATFLYMTHLLERAADDVSCINHPRGIRDANEKIACLDFPRWIAPTIVSTSAEEIQKFQSSLRSDLVIKPLDERGGRGVFIFPYRRGRISRLNRATRRGKKFVMAQQFIPLGTRFKEKRIVLVDGNIVAAYEKRPPKKDFRANLSLGGTFHAANLSRREKALMRELRPYLLRKKLLWVGIDVRAEKLIEINVTCPAGLTEAKALYPSLPLAPKLADFLEARALQRHR